ncbi:Bug family tripartite tricarboxylate transporter substrate binding protein [Rhodovulum kholense]|uniref:Tripartite-type tricarboxylate transporter receptor subunit TctC n=1 Tax=Rhodovulum kholense TaxID=453584 RepID=A0A8E3APR6_9RHOB|nr:tripartite tricarboxylate transporter substrate binding protein [Rhodovulum kholense]PTW46632.1 tripartite-type tricarboxylate transporter receptor subunit TctC [Rhodovulum kholense]
MKRITASLAAIGLLAGTAALADYPEKPITIVVPYGAGGGSDIMVRTVAPYIEKYLGDGASIVVENRTGASGIIGWQAVHDARPDGYTIGVITTPSIVTKPIEGKAEFTWQDFTIIANMVTDPAALNVKKGSQFKDIAGLVDYAKENPKVVTMATGNFGGDDHLAGLQLEKLTGAEFTFVPFPGVAARNATMGGHVAVGSFNLGEAVNYQDSIDILGIMADKRSDLAPEVPTLKEQGFDVVASSQRGFAGPKGMPDEAVEKLSAAIAQAVNDPDFRKDAQNQGVVLDFADSADFTAQLDAFDKAMRKIWAESPWLE